MHRTTRLFLIIAGVFIVTLYAFGIGGCPPSTTSSEKADRGTVQAQQGQYRASQPVPTFDYSTERDAAIQLYSARNENVNTHTVWRSDLGAIEGHCPSIGYPIPYDTSLTNPLQPAYNSSYCGAGIEQAEPNGLFASHNSIATWVRCTYKGKVTPVYVESKVTAYPYPVVIDHATNMVSPAADAVPSVTIEDRRKQ